MTDAHLWAAIALAALCAFAFFVVLFAKAQVPMANAWKILSQVHANDDLRIDAILSRAKKIREARGARSPQGQPALENPTIPPTLQDIFPGSGALLQEQPDSEEETVG